jgi:hypothetical protein
MIPAGFKFFRGRTHQKKKKYRDARDLGSPPPDKANANRMSAEGISVFYGAGDHATALSYHLPMGAAEALTRLDKLGVNTP